MSKRYNYFRYLLLIGSIMYSVYIFYIIYFSNLLEYENIELVKRYIFISLFISLPLSIPIFILFQMIGLFLLYLLGEDYISKFPYIGYFFQILQYIVPVAIIYFQWFVYYPKKIKNLLS